MQYKFEPANDNIKGTGPMLPGGGASCNIHFGDCLEKLKLLASSSISLIMFDPPYATTALKWDKHLNYEAVIAEFERILTPTGTVVAFGSDQFTFHLFNAFAQHGKAIKYRYSAIWMKNRATGFLHAANRPLKAHEDIMVFSKGLMGHAGTGPGKTLKRMTYNPQNLVELAAPIKSRNGKMNGGVTAYKGDAGGRYLGKLVGTTASRNADCAYLGREPACSKTAERRRADSHLRGREQEDGSIILWGKPRKQTHTGYTKTIFEYERESIPNDPHRHPTKKPQALLKELVATFSNSGETVLDPTMGSGTTGAACVELGDRSFIGIERDAGYFAIAEVRVFGARKAVA